MRGALNLEVQPLLRWLEEAGLPEAALETQGETLIVKLSPQRRNRLLADAALRKNLVRKVQGRGFSRVAVEL